MHNLLQMKRMKRRCHQHLKGGQENPRPRPKQPIHLRKSQTTTETSTKTVQTTPSPTRTSYQSWTGVTATQTQVNTSFPTTATATKTSVPSITRTSTTIPTSTQTQETGWQGEWSAFLEISDGVYVTGTLIIDVAGTDLTGTGTFDGIAYAFDGALYQNGDIATGSWTSHPMRVLSGGTGLIRVSLQAAAKIIGDFAGHVWTRPARSLPDETPR